MDKLVIEGGQRLSGEVRVGGAKNSALPLLAASLLVEGTCRFTNVPRVRDIVTMRKLLTMLGADVQALGDEVVVDATEIDSVQAPYDLVRTMRASVLVLGPLLARMGEARVSLPGGCAIGQRPIDLHLKGLEAMGAEVAVEDGYVVAKARRLKGARITLDLPSVTGTENLMMAAALADGTTTIENAAREPEIVDLAGALSAMGAKVEGQGGEIVTVEGRTRLRPIAHRVIADRIEAGTLVAAVGLAGGEVRVVGANPGHMGTVLAKLGEFGLEIREEADAIRALRSGPIGSADLRTLPYPGFPTDMQAQVMALACLGEGTSVITETVFENRFMHAQELRRLGADVRTNGRTAIVRGVERLEGAPMMATDLRASASLVLAALAAEGESEVLRIYHLDRGYEKLDEKLARLGARIRRVKE